MRVVDPSPCKKEDEEQQREQTSAQPCYALYPQMGGSQNGGPFLGPYYNLAPNI